MSEYQYYEFRAVDCPLDKAAMAALRQITSRAEITPTRLVNEYHFGNFKGSPVELVRQHFDAFAYHANWGSRRLMLRLPKGTIDPVAVEPYCANEAVGLSQTPTHVILDFDVGYDGVDAYYGAMEREEHVLDRLLPLRDELMAGDMRPLYLGWLAGLDSETGECDDDDHEPPAPPGLGELSHAQDTLADFLEINPSLLDAAAAGAPPAILQKGPSSVEIKDWIEALPLAEKNRLLVRLVEGKTPTLGQELLRRFRKEFARMRPTSTASGSTRSAGNMRRSPVSCSASTKRDCAADWNGWRERSGDDKPGVSRPHKRDACATAGRQ